MREEGSERERERKKSEEGREGEAEIRPHCFLASSHKAKTLFSIMLFVYKQMG